MNTGPHRRRWRYADCATGWLDAQLPSSSGGRDPRISFEQPVAREAVFELVRGHDVVVSPSLWECWPNVVLEALSQNRPVLATPVGGQVELASRAAAVGWPPTQRGGADDCARASFDEPDRLPELIESSAPRATSRSSPTSTPSERLWPTGGSAARRRREPFRASAPPLVSVVVPYFQLDQYVEQTLESILGQTYRRLEVIVVNDGRFALRTRILEELAWRYRPLTVLYQQNSGLGRARNFGIRQSHGKYVLPLDADDLIEPKFVERCVEVLRPASVAYVNSWSRYVDEAGDPWPGGVSGYRPFTNERRLARCPERCRPSVRGAFAARSSTLDFGTASTRRATRTGSSTATFATTAFSDTRFRRSYSSTAFAVGRCSAQWRNRIMSG